MDIKKLVKENYIIIGIILLAIILRLYYFSVTINQTLWWDELSYGDLAKNFVTHQWDNQRFILGETNIRPLFMSYFWSLLIRIDFTEAMSKFILEIIPSILVVILTYLIAIKMYNKRIALISTFLMAISWLSIFYSMRFMTHIPGLLASFGSIYFFFRAIETEKIKFKYFASSIFLLFISVLFRWNYGIVGFAYLLVLLFTYKSNFFKQKTFWAGGIIGAIPILIFFGINLKKYGSLFPALSFVSSHAAASVKPFAFYTFGFIPHILQMPLWILFTIGFFIVLVKLIIGYDSISQIKTLKSHLFIFVVLVLNMAFLIFYIKYAEDRYLFECLMSMLFMVSISLEAGYNFLQKYSKPIAAIFILVILAWGANSQYVYGNSIIMGKIDSYSQMKETFIWLKENVPRDSVVIGSGIEPYTIYYADLNPIEFYPNMTESILNGSMRVDFFVYHAFTPQDEDYQTVLQQNQENLTVIYASFFDKEQKNLAVLVSRFNKP
jgi:hypothetical protein